MYKHKLVCHPEVQVDSVHNVINVKDMILNLIAEQNMELMEVVMDLNKFVKGSIDQLSKEIKETRPGGLQPEHQHHPILLSTVTTSKATTSSTATATTRALTTVGST